MKNIAYPLTILTIVLSSFFTVKMSYGQNIQTHKVQYPLNITTTSYKDIPNVITKKISENEFLIGYSDYVTSQNQVRPVFKVRDRYLNDIGQYYFDLFGAFMDDNGEGNIHLMDMSEVTGNNQIYITGFISLNNANSNGFPPCIPFVALIDLNTYDVVGASIIGDGSPYANMVPYNIIYDQEHNHLIICGEEYDSLNFDPMSPSVSSGLQGTDLPGKGIVLCLNGEELSSQNWALRCSDLLSNGDSNLGSNFENIAITSMGYTITGKVMSDVVGFGAYVSWPIVLHVESGGNVIWQKTFQISNNFARGCATYYSAHYDQIFVAFQNPYAHTFGLVAFDPSSGTHGPLSYVLGMAEPIAMRIGSYESVPEFIFVGGTEANPLNVHSGISSPFLANFIFDPNTLTFVATPNGSDVPAFSTPNGRYLSSPQFSNYFNWLNHSFGMFSLDDNSSINTGGVWNTSAIFASRDSTHNNIVFYKLTFYDESCNMTPRELSIYPWALTESPNVVLEAVEYRGDFYEPNRQYQDSSIIDLLCGYPDFQARPGNDDIRSGSNYLKSIDNDVQFSGNELNNTSTDKQNQLVMIFDVLGKQIYKGKYSDFLNNKENYILTNEACVVFVRFIERNQTEKIVFTK